jgi:hypothetical protein
MRACCKGRGYNSRRAAQGGRAARCSEQCASIRLVLPWYADVRREARSLYWRGWGVTQIAEEFAERGVTIEGKAVARSTIESWKQREKWAEAAPIRAAEESLLVRFQQLVAKEKKDGRRL